MSPATLSRVISFLDREAMLDRDPKGAVTGVDWQRIIRRWAEDYSFTKSNRIRTFIDPRGLDSLRKKVPAVKWTYAVTGSFAASMIAPVTAPRLVQLYVKEISAAAEALELREAESGANVMLAEPFNRVVFERTQKRDGIICAALSQVAVDLLTSPGRGPEEAEALLKWMATNDDAWRN